MVTRLELLSPLRGSNIYCGLFPRLAPGATLCRPFGATFYCPSGGWMSMLFPA